MVPPRCQRGRPGGAGEPLLATTLEGATAGVGCAQRHGRHFQGGARGLIATGDVRLTVARLDRPARGPATNEVGVHGGQAGRCCCGHSTVLASAARRGGLGRSVGARRPANKPSDSGTANGSTCGCVRYLQDDERGARDRLSGAPLLLGSASGGERTSTLLHDRYPFQSTPFCLVCRRPPAPPKKPVVRL